MQEIALMHAHMAKLLECGVDGEWLSKSRITPDQARELLKGILYLREMYPQLYGRASNLQSF
jgi:hypothetical protein